MLITAGGTTSVSTGVFAPSIVSGTVFNDSNADGIPQPTDAGLAGQTVNLIGPDGTTILATTTTTGATGSYSFTGIPPGNATVQVIARPGDIFSTPGAGTTPITITSGSAIVVNAGEYAPAPAGGTVSGTVFNDSNADGIPQPTDAGLAGQTVNLIGPDGTTILATHHDGCHRQLQLHRHPPRQRHRPGHRQAG